MDSAEESTPSTSSSLPRRTAIIGAVAGAGLLATTANGANASAASTPAVPSSPVPPTGDVLVTLGVKGGPPPAPIRIGFSGLLQVNGMLYLIDAGRGSFMKFTDLGFSFTKMKSMFMTHLHSDHLFDYYNYFASAVDPATFPPRSAPVAVFGPGSAGGLPPSRTGEEPITIGSNPTPGIVEVTNSLHDAYAYSTNIFSRNQGAYDPRTLMDVAAIKLPDVGANYLNTAPDMEPFAVTSDENLTVSAILVPHYDVFPAFAFRFDLKSGKSITFSGDTVKSNNVVKLATDTDVLVHESVYILNTVFHQNSHTSAIQVGEVAAAANAKSLVLAHYSGGTTEAEWQAAIRQNYQGPTTIGQDGQIFPL